MAAGIRRIRGIGRPSSSCAKLKTMKKPNLFKPREKFLVLEIGPAGTDGLFLSVDEERNIIFEKCVKNIDLKKFFGSPVRSVTQKSWEGNYLFKSHRKVIAVGGLFARDDDPDPARPAARGAARSKARSILPELENLIAQAMGKIFNQCRSEAAKRLGIHEIDTILVGAKAREFQSGWPPGGEPRRLYRQRKFRSCSSSPLPGARSLRTLKQFFNAPEDFFFAESAQARLWPRSRAPESSHSTSSWTTTRSAHRFLFCRKTKDDHPVLYREKMAVEF